MQKITIPGSQNTLQVVGKHHPWEALQRRIAAMESFASMMPAPSSAKSLVESDGPARPQLESALRGTKIRGSKETQHTPRCLPPPQIPEDASPEHWPSYQPSNCAHLHFDLDLLYFVFPRMVVGKVSCNYGLILA